MSNEQKPMTVGDLKRAIADLPDEMPLVTYDDTYEDYRATEHYGMPMVLEMVELSFEKDGNMTIPVEDFERRRHWWTKQPTIVRKFTALEL